MFDQNAKAQKDEYKLEIKEDIPSKYKRLVTRLQHEHLNSYEIKNSLIEEDTRVLDFKNFINKEIWYKKNIEEKDKTIEENKKAIEENEKTIKQSILTLSKFLNNPQEIANELGISPDFVNQVLKK